MNVKVRLRPILNKVNLPTVIKTAMLPGDSQESLFVATQVGEIFYFKNGRVSLFLDIRSRIIQLGASGGYDERGLLGLAFHPQFSYNGLFYLHYSVAGTQGPGAAADPFTPKPCDPSTLNLKWTNRETQYDHIDTVEEWTLQANGQPQKRRTLLNLRRPFSNHNGFNSLTFSPETGKLVLTTGDGGSGYDPYNLSQDDMEIAGKIIEIDVAQHSVTQETPPAATRFNELPVTLQQSLTVMAKGVRNIPGISFQKVYNQYIKYVGNVGQDLAEAIFSFVQYRPIPVTQIVQNSEADKIGFINFGWRGWEGSFPTSTVEDCSENSTLTKKTIAYYDEAVKTSINHLHPLTEYFHKDPRPDKFGGTALTGVQPYNRKDVPYLSGTVLFTDLTRREQSPARGVLAYTSPRGDYKLGDFNVIKVDYDFGSEPAYYVSLGTNLNQTKFYLGVYGSMKVSDYYKGTIFEIVP